MDGASFNRVMIDVEALRFNYRLISRRVGGRVRVMAMVKGDGYGHGMVRAAAAFADAGCDSFGVGEIAEGVALREAGCEGEIFILLGFEAGQEDYLFSHRLTPVVFTTASLQALEQAAAKRNRPISAFVKFDCGMGRLGFSPEAAAGLGRYADTLSNVRIAGIMSHYPCADDRSSSCSRTVYARFEDVVASLGGRGEMATSICNSGGLLYFPETRGDLVRAGISLYGYYPDGRAGRDHASAPLLKPAMQVATRIIQVREVAAGSGISYGHTYTAEHDMKLAVLPFGYSDGYPRMLSNRAEVLIRGRRAPIRGRVCMNICMADVTDIPDVETGDEVLVLGRQGRETIDADDIAGWAETISYEIVCLLGNNNMRQVVGRQ